MAKVIKNIGEDLVGHLWDRGWTYIKTVVDVVREPILILDKNFRVMVANEPFYRMFQVEPKDTEKKHVYDLGNGQWNIPSLRKLLEDILPKNSFFKGFEVAHEFPIIGRKVMILNARQIYFDEENGGGGGKASEIFPPIILLAMEDVTEMMAVAETLAGHTRRLGDKLNERTEKLEACIVKLEREIIKLKK